MSPNPDMEIVALDAHPSDDEVAAVAALAQAVQDDDRPGDPPLSVRELAGRMRYPLPQHLDRTWVARSEGRVIGRLRAVMDGRPANEGFVELDDVEVHPGHRRQGVALALARRAVADLVPLGARTFMLWPWDDAGRAFCEHLGLTFRQEERQSRLMVAELDGAQQDEWIAAPKAREAGYRVVSFVEPVPAEHLAAWVAAKDAMADAPLDDVEWVHEPTTADWVRAVERVHQAREVDVFGSLALAPDGEAAGMTAIFIVADRPRFAHQEDTAVVPAHRGYGLGRWLKAANLRQALEAVPEVELVQTYNAETNGPMLDINVAMGFRPARTYYAYQADVAAVVAALDLT
jgi:mycothiol synthase